MFTYIHCIDGKYLQGVAGLVLVSHQNVQLEWDSKLKIKLSACKYSANRLPASNNG